MGYFDDLFENNKNKEEEKKKFSFAENPAKTVTPTTSNFSWKRSMEKTMKNFDEQAQRKVDYNNSSGREKEIEKNLWEGINNDKNIREEVTLGAKEMFRSRYGYNAADAGKKALIDKVWNDARKRMPASGVFQAENKPKEPLVYDAKTGEYKPRSELIAEAQKEANSGKWSIQQSNRDTSNDPKVQSYVAMEQAREYENFRNRNLLDTLISRPLVNKVENSFAGTDWNPFDDPLVEAKKTGNFWGDVKEEAGAYFQNTLKRYGGYILDKVGRVTTLPITSSEDPEVFKQKTAQYDRERNRRYKEIANTDWGQAENQDTEYWGVGKQYLRGAGRYLNAMMEDMARKAGNYDLANFFGENSDAMGIEMMRHNQENADTIGEKIFAGGLNLLGAIVYGTAGSALGGGGALAGATAFGYSQEYGSMKTELIDAGVDNARASDISQTYAVGASLLEGIFPAGKVQKLFGPSASQVVKGSYKQAFKEVVGDFIKEGTTEGLQELLANTFKKQEGLIDSYWNNVAESALIGGLLGGAVGAVTNTKTRELYNDMKRNINVALDIVQNGEKYNQTTQMIARTVLQNFQNITKEPAFVAQTQNSAVEIETVQYDEKKFSANARVENGTQNTNLPFETVFATKEEAVVDSMSRASEYMEGSALQAPMMEIPDELLAQYDEEMNRKYEDAVQDFPEKTKEAVRQDFDQLSDKEFSEIFGDEIDAIRSKKHKTLEDEVILEKYDELVEKAYADTTDEAIKGIEDEVKYFTEDGTISNQDIQELARITYKTLAPATMRNTLIRKKDDFFTPSEKRIIQVTPEGTIEALMRDFRTFKHGLKKIIAYKEQGKPSKNVQKLEELLDTIRKGGYDALETTDEAWDYFVTTFYDYKQHGLPRTTSRRNAGMVQKPEGGRTRSIGRGLDRNADSVHGVHEKEERVNTAKQIAKDTEEKFAAFKKNDTKNKTFGNIKKFSTISSYLPEEGLHLNPRIMLLTQKKRETTFETGKTLYEDYILEILKNAIRNNSILKGENVALKPKDIHAVYTLDNLIDHPDLFAKYPQIKDTEIVFADFHSRKKRGLTSGGKIYLNTYFFKKDSQRAYSTLVHEIEHLKQGIKNIIKYGDFGEILNRDEIEHGATERQSDYLESVGRDRIKWENRYERKNTDISVFQKKDVKNLQKNGENKGKRTPSIEWKKGLELFAKGELPSNHTISIGKPTGKLKELIGDSELTITQKRLTRKSTIHDYTIQDIMNLPDFIDNPILLYEAGDIKGRSLVIITDLSIGNNKIAIAINYHRDKAEVTEIKSIHQKSIERLLDDKNKGKIDKIYLEDNKKISSWLGSGSSNWNQPTTRGDSEIILSEKNKKSNNFSKDEYIKYHTFQIVDERKWEGQLTGATIKLEDGELKFSIDREDDETIMIIDIVEAKTPRKGIGTKLMKKAEQIADNEGVDRIELGAHPQSDVIDSESLREFYENLGYEVNEESEFDGVPYYDMSRTPYGESDESIGVKTPEQLEKEWEEENIKTFDKDAPEYKKPNTALSESIEEMEEKYSARTNKDKTIFKRTKITQRMQNQAAKNKQELLQKIEQLNKLAMSLGVHREAKKMKEGVLGQYDPKLIQNTKGGWEAKTIGGVKLEKKLSPGSEEYMSVLAHELGHSLEWQMFGVFDTRTIEVFGEELSSETQDIIWSELKENTIQLEGESAVKENPDYYLRPTELLARFLQRWFESPIELNEVAPTAMEFFVQQSVHHPIISEYLNAVHGAIDQYQKTFGFNKLRDLRRYFEYILGETAGRKAYNTIKIRDIQMERAKTMFGDILKEKFKGVENEKTLFEAIEATLETKNGIPVFGTRDFVDVPTWEYKELSKQGWVKADNQEGVLEGQVRMWNWRYTKEQGEVLFSQLNEAEKKILKDFTVAKEEAVDFINRNIIAERYKIENTVEGWIHHFWEQEPGTSFGKPKLGDKMASSRKTRTQEKGFVKDAQKALYKALVDLEGEDVFNNWLRDFIPRVTKPLADGERVKDGWREIEGDFIKGFLEQGMRNDYMITEKGTFKIQKGRYQIPVGVYDKFSKIAGLLDNHSKTVQMLDVIANLWQVNVLAHPGTAVTNGISGGIQYALKITTDIYKAILTGDVSLVKNDITSLFTALTHWNQTPDWMWGSADSTYYEVLGSRRYDGKIGVIHDKIGKIGNIVLKPMQAFEQYWKKVIARASGSLSLSHLSKMTKEGLPPLDMSDREILSMVNDMVDLYGYDYENVPLWLNSLSKNPIGKLTLPFKRYMYKYFSMIVDHMITPLYDSNMHWKDRLSRVLGFVTWMGLVSMIFSAFGDDEEKETPNKNSPNVPMWMNIRGKMFIGKDEEGKEQFIRMAKYPGFNLMGFIDTLSSAINGDVSGAMDNLGVAMDASTDGFNSAGPLGQLVAHHIFGWKNQYEQHKSSAQLFAGTASQFIPGFRILGDLAQYNDEYKRKATNWQQEFTRLIPFYSKDMADTLRGNIYVDKVPTGENSTITVPRKNNANDTLLSMITGIYKTRIDPDAVKAYMGRYEKNIAEKEAKAEKDKRDEDFIINTAGMSFDEVKSAIAKEYNPKTSSEKTHATNLLKKWVTSLEYKDNELVQELSNAKTTGDKIMILREMHSNMEENDFKNLVNDLRNKKIISPVLWKEYKNTD